MGDAASRARDMRATRIVLECVELHGNEWWSAWGGLQWSPTSLFGGTPFRGANRVALATAALASGYEDRRWATSRQLADHGYGPGRGERPTLAGGGRRESITLYNAAQATRRRAQGVRHGTPVPPEDDFPDMDARAMASATAALASACRYHMSTNASGPARPTFDESTHSAVIPPGTSWRSSASCLMALVEAAARAQVARATRPRPEGAELVACLVALFALSDCGIPPSTCAAHGAERPSLTVPWAEAARRNPGLLASCAERAEALAMPLTAIIEASAVPAPDETTGDSCAAGVDDGRHANERLAHPKESCPPLATKLPTDAPSDEGGPAGYTLRSILAETTRASAALTSAARRGR